VARVKVVFKKSQNVLMASTVSLHTKNEFFASVAHNRYFRFIHNLPFAITALLLPR